MCIQIAIYRLFTRTSSQSVYEHGCRRDTVGAQAELRSKVETARNRRDRGSKVR